MSRDIKAKLYYWYIDWKNYNGMNYMIIHGNVTGHSRFRDSIHISSSPIESVDVDMENGVVVVQTKDTIYSCPMSYCCFRKQDTFPDLVPGYPVIKEQYAGKIEYPKIGQGKVLLVMSDFDEYYFHSMCYIPWREDVEMDYEAEAHIGTFQDSFLICSEDFRVDFRYFPHEKNVEFYSESTGGYPWYIENIGNSDLFFRTSCGVIKVASGERKEVCKENRETEVSGLKNDDLYPANICNY